MRGITGGIRQMRNKLQEKCLILKTGMIEDM